MINTDVDIEVLNIVSLVFMVMSVFGPPRYSGLFTTLWALTSIGRTMDRMRKQKDPFDNPWNYVSLVIGFALLYQGYRMLRDRHRRFGSFVGMPND